MGAAVGTVDTRANADNAFRALDDSARAAERLRRALELAAPDWPRRAEAEKTLRSWTGGR